MSHTLNKTSKYLEFYKEHLYNYDYGMNKGGLCSIFGGEELFKLMMPPIDQLIILRKDALMSSSFWGSPEWGRAYEFTPLRQTIVLFMHEMTINPIL